MSDPVVEELLEKGARAAFPNAWAASWPGTGEEAVKAQLWAVETVGTVLDAMFPGWREGKLQFGLLAPNGNVHGPISNRVTAESAAFTNDRLVSRWAGPWVPVEEGTDG